MMAHEDKISDACYDAVLTVAEGVDLAIVKVHSAAVACAGDIDKRAELLTPCRAEATDLEARAKK